MIQGSTTTIPNDYDSDNVKFLYELFVKFNSALNINEFQPNDQEYDYALELNALLLKKYGKSVLLGEEWI